MRLMQGLLAAVLVASATACASDNLEVDTPDVGVGAVTHLELKQAVQAAMYEPGETDMSKLSFGKMDVRYLEIDRYRYVVHWDDHETFTQLKLGDKVSFRPENYGRFLRVDGSGAARGNYRMIQITPAGAKP